MITYIKKLIIYASIAMTGYSYYKFNTSYQLPKVTWKKKSINFAEYKDKYEHKVPVPNCIKYYDDSCKDMVKNKQ